MGIYLVYRPGYISFTRAGVFIHYRDVHFKPFVNWLSVSLIHQVSTDVSQTGNDRAGQQVKLDVLRLD